MNIALLANHPQHLPTIAQWLYDEWGYLSDKLTVENAIRTIGKVMSTDSLPVHLIALENDQPIGFIALKFREMEEYPEREHWLGSLYVIPEARGRKVGSALIQEVIKYAQQHNVPKLSLQTIHLDGGLYTKHGWKPVEQITSHGEEVLVMERMIEPLDYDFSEADRRSKELDENPEQAIPWEELKKNLGR